MVPIDLDQLAAGRDELNVPLEAGDVIHVPRAGSYYVGGSVERSGSFFLRGKTTAEQAIMAAGGPKKVADSEDVRIYRTRPGGEREILKFNMEAVREGRGPDGRRAAEERRGHRRAVRDQGLPVRNPRIRARHVQHLERAVSDAPCRASAG